jgi:Fic family protein
MIEFVAWLDGIGSSGHPVSLATGAHGPFVTIHPFRDGNGRVGRLLINLLLERAGHLLLDHK